MKIKARDAECRDGMVAAELAFIDSCNSRNVELRSVPSTGLNLQPKRASVVMQASDSSPMRMGAAGANKAIAR